MTAYSYTAYTNSGQRRRGVLVADSETHVREILSRQELFPEEIHATESSVPGKRRRPGFPVSGRLRREDLVLFTRQLAVLLDAGLPVDAALEMIMQSESGSAVKRLAARSSARIREGQSLARALRAEEGALPTYFCAAVAAGERSGALAEVFETLAEFAETRRTETGKIANALLYPAFVASVAVIVAAILVIHVAPEIVAMLQTAGQPLPLITEFTIGVGAFIHTHWISLAAAGVLGLLGARVLTRASTTRRHWERLVLRLPGVGRLVRLSAAAQYLRTLALVLTSRLPVVEATRCAEEAIVNGLLREEAAAAHNMLESGHPLAACLRKISALPPITIRLIDSGEKSSRLAVMTERAAWMAEERFNADMNRISTLLEPVLMLLIGVLVLAIVLSVLLPIFDLQTAFGP